MSEERDDRFEREPRVSLARGGAWGPLGSTLDEEDVARGPESTEGRYARSRLAFHERYEVVRTLAVSGMAEVRLCKDRPFSREVAMKVLLHGPSNDSSRWRFFREARVQAQLSHPAIVPVYDLGVDPDGGLFFTMKWVRGLRFDRALGEVRDGVEDGVFTERKLLARFAQLCLAVHYAHSRGVVHRDLKPSNIILGEFGEVYLLDWGLAKVLSESNPRYEPIDDATGAMRTSDGAVLGTIGYMAPEQLQGEVDRVTALSDVYSLGAMLFELLAQESVHQGSAAMQALSSLRTDGASPRERRPDRAAAIDEALDRACVSSLRVDPDERGETAKSIADAIERALTG